MSLVIGFYEKKHYAQRGTTLKHISKDGRPLCGAAGLKENYAEIDASYEFYDLFKVTCKKCISKSEGEIS